MSTKIEIRRVMFDYEKMCEMIVNELDFAVTDDNVPENEWEKHVKYLIERGLHEYFEWTEEIHHLNNVVVYVSKNKNKCNILADGSEIYDKPNYDFNEQALGENLPDCEYIIIDNKRILARNYSIGTILRKIRLEIDKNIENECYTPKKLEKIMKVFYKFCGDEDYRTMLKNNLVKILKNYK